MCSSQTAWTQIFKADRRDLLQSSCKSMVRSDVDVRRWARLAVSIPVYPRVHGWGWGQGGYSLVKFLRTKLRKTFLAFKIIFANSRHARKKKDPLEKSKAMLRSHSSILTTRPPIGRCSIEHSAMLKFPNLLWMEAYQHLQSHCFFEFLLQQKKTVETEIVAGRPNTSILNSIAAWLLVLSSSF